MNYKYKKYLLIGWNRISVCEIAIQKIWWGFSIYRKYHKVLSNIILVQSLVRIHKPMKVFLEVLKHKERCASAKTGRRSNFPGVDEGIEFTHYTGCLDSMRENIVYLSDDGINHLLDIEKDIPLEYLESHLRLENSRHNE